MRFILVMMTALFAAGCSGPKYACKAPEGVGCQSISATYQAALANELPITNAQDKDEKKTDQKSPIEEIAEKSRAPAEEIRQAFTQTKTGAPVRRGARVLRVWYTPWVDAQGDWHDQGYVHVVVDNGRWLLYENRKAIGATQSFRNLQPPKVTAPVRSESVNTAPAMSQEEARSAGNDFVQGKGVEP